MLKLIRTFSRPLSPHLTVYSSQLTSLFSIWHRITGITLIIFIIVSLCFLKIISYKISNIFINLSCVNFWICNTLFLNSTLFFSYHVLNGLRHIIWDLGYNLSLNCIKFSVQVLIISLLIICIIITYKILI